MKTGLYKLILLLLTLCLSLALVACGKGGKGDDGDDTLPPCTHRDANDDNKCDKCGERFSYASDTHMHIPTAPTLLSIVTPTCTEYGVSHEVAYCADPDCGIELYRNVLPIMPTGHITAASVAENTVPATCTTDGSYDAVVYCSVSGCGIELSRTPTAIPTPGHTPSHAVIENTVAASCTTDGSYDEVIYCAISNCRAAITRESRIIDAGHIYDGKYCAVCGAERVSEGLEFTDIDAGSCYVSGIGGCTDTEIFIPAVSPDGKKVVGIGYAAFRYLPIVDVIIPNTVTYIGAEAFESCSNLASISIPESVTSIDRAVFQFCSSLTSVSLPSKITSISGALFGSCSSLTSISIPDRVESIASCAFFNCGIIAINIPDSVTTIGNWAFADCSSLVTVKIGSGVKDFDNYVFEGCPSLQSVYFNISSISDSDFGVNTFNRSGTSEGVRLTIGKNVTRVPSALCRHSNITSVEFEAGSICESIGSYAFCDCTGLASITIPESVTSIGDSAFYGCTGLTNVTIGSGVTSIGYYTFYDCHSLTNVRFEDPSGWSLYSSGSWELVESVDEAYLSDSYSAAQYLKALGDYDMKRH